jgi:hypothetical protein
VSPLKLHDDSSPRPRRAVVYASETIGLLLIAIILLVFTLVRYWNNIHWSWR